MSLTQEYIDNYPFNIESPQGLTVMWSPDIVWDFQTQGFPSPDESVFDWSSTFIPYTYNQAQILGINHVWMKMKVGTNGNWSMPMRVNYPSLVVGPEGDQGIPGTDGGPGVPGPRGKYVTIEYANSIFGIVPASSATVMYVRFREEGKLPSNWFKIVGTDGVGIGGTGLPAGGLVDQLLVRTALGYGWIDQSVVYSDTDVLAVIGPIGNANPMNHNRYTDAEAVIAMGVKANANPLNHDRYTDLEAATAALTAFGVVAPIDITAGVISHLDTDGNKHIPVGGNAGEGLATNGAGVYTWEPFITLDVIDDAAGAGITDKVYSVDKVLSLIGIINTYGIKYSWADAAAKAAEVGMVLGDLGLQQDTREVYRYDGAAWQFFFDLDGAHDHDARYYTETELNTSGAGGQVHWDNITNVPASFSNLWQKVIGNVDYILSPIDSDIESVEMIGSQAAFALKIENGVLDGYTEYQIHQYLTFPPPMPLDASIYFGIGTLGNGSRPEDFYLVANGQAVDGSFKIGSVNGPFRFIVDGTVTVPVLSDILVDSTGMLLDAAAIEHAVTTTDHGYLTSEAKKTAFNTDFGTTAGTSAEGDHVHTSYFNYKGNIPTANNLNTYLPSTDEHYEVYDIVAGVAGVVPTNFPTGAIVNSYDTGQAITVNTRFTLIVRPLNSATMCVQEIHDNQGIVATRTYNGSSFTSWEEVWATDTNMEAKLSSRTDAKRQAVSAYKLAKHSTRVNVTMNGTHLLDASHPLSTRILTDGRIELSGRLYPTGHVSMSAIGTINAVHNARIKYNANGVVFVQGVGTTGATTMFKIVEATGAITYANGASTQGDYTFNEVIAVD